MRRADIISDIGTIANVGSKYNALLGRSLKQDGLDRYATMHPWPHYRDLGYITTIAPYITGTVSVTNGSKTVTGSGTTFTVAMVGRKIRINDETAFYEVAGFTSTTEIALAVPYQGDTDSGLTYSIFKDEYRLAANVYRPLNMRQLEDGTVMLPLLYQDLDAMSPDLDNEGDPLWYSVVGRRADTYQTGTVAVTAGTKTLTGTSTNWTSVDGLTRGSRIAIVDTEEVFTVKSVDSNTSITIYESPVTTDASSSYVAFMDNIVVQVNDVPDAARNLYYRFHRLPAPFPNDYDEPDMPREHHHFLIWSGLSTINALLGKDTTSANQEGRFLRMIEEQWTQLSKSIPGIVAVKESMDVGEGLLMFPRYPSNYGVPLGI